MINLSETKSCLRRSVYAGLKYSGIEDKCGWIPLKACEEDLQLVIERYPQLELKTQYISTDEAVPLLVVYETNILDEFGNAIYHAVFVSDSCPFGDGSSYYKVEWILSGWEQLAKHPIKLRWYKYSGILMDFYKKYIGIR